MASKVVGSTPLTSAQEFSVLNGPGISVLPPEVIRLIRSYLDIVSSVAFRFTCNHVKFAYTEVKQVIDPLLPKFGFCKKAAQFGHLELIQWGVNQNCQWTPQATAAAAKRGHLQVLQWAWTQGCLGFTDTADGALLGNQRKVLEWLVKIKVMNKDAAASHGLPELYRRLNFRCDGTNERISDAICELIARPKKPKNITTCKALIEQVNDEYLYDYGLGWLNHAVQHGNLEIFKFLIGRGIEFGDQSTEHIAMYGQIEILKYIFVELEKRDLFNERIADIAVKEGHWDIVQWLMDKGIKGSIDAAVYAAERGREKELELMLNAGWPMSNEVCNAAAKHGHLNLVKQLIKNGLFCEGYFLYFCVARQGNVELLNKMLKARKAGMENLKHANDVPKRYSLAIGAASGGNVKSLLWIKEQGFEWRHPIVAREAARGGCLEALEWLINEGCPFEREDLYSHAANYEHVPIIEWIVGRAIEASLNVNVSVVVAKSGRKDLLKKLVDQGFPVNATTIGAAASAGHWDIVDWLKKKGCDMDKQVIEAAAAQGKDKILSSYHATTAKHTLKLFYLMRQELNLLAKYGYWEIYKKTVTACIAEHGTKVLDLVKENGYGFDVKAVTAAANILAESGDSRVLEWLQQNHYLDKLGAV